METIAKVSDFFDNDKRIIYAIAGLEIGENGTPHIQGFVHMDIDPKKGGIKFWKYVLPEGGRAHLENARGPDESNREYCSKEGPYYEVGAPKLPTENVWTRIIAASFVSMEEAMSIDAEITVKYINQIEKLCHINGNPKMDVQIELRDWQKIVLQKLAAQDDRKILFVVDEEGGKGKSMLTKHMMTEMNTWACMGEFMVLFIAI